MCSTRLRGRPRIERADPATVPTTPVGGVSGLRHAHGVVEGDGDRLEIGWAGSGVADAGGGASGADQLLRTVDVSAVVDVDEALDGYRDGCRLLTAAQTATAGIDRSVLVPLTWCAGGCFHAGLVRSSSPSDTAAGCSPIQDSVQDARKHQTDEAGLLGRSVNWGLAIGRSGRCCRFF